jgi:Domain of unknown function (DUF892)
VRQRAPVCALAGRVVFRREQRLKAARNSLAHHVFLRVFLGKSYDFVGFQESREFKGTKTALICEALRRAAIKMQPVIARTTNQRKGNMRLDTLEKLYISELRDLYSAENQLLKALPKMAKGEGSNSCLSSLTKVLKERRATE